MFAEVLFLFYQASLLGSREGKVGPDSVHFSRSVMSNSLRPHGLQHAGPPCPSPTPRVYSNSCLSVHPVGDAIQPSHLLSLFSPPAFNLSQCQENSLENEKAIHSIFLPGKSHGQKSLVDYCPWGHKETDIS